MLLLHTMLLSQEGLDLVGSHPEDFSNLLLFHNVGSVMMPGSKEKEFTANFDDREELIKYYNLNLISRQLCKKKY